MLWMFSCSTSQKLFLEVVVTDVLEVPPPGPCDPAEPRAA